MTDAQKQALRSAMRRRRRNLPQAEQDAAAQAVLALLEQYPPYQRARTVMAYVACRGELSLAPVLEDILARQKMLVLPRCERPGVMTARRVKSLDQLREGAYGLLEPSDACAACPPQEIDLILVPGVAFDAGGGRLGQGGGYYDGFLEKTRAVRAGVCHGFALLDRVPREAHDEDVDDVITPDGIVRTQRNMNEHRRT